MSNLICKVCSNHARSSSDFLSTAVEILIAIALVLPCLLSSTGLAAPAVARPADGSRVRAQDEAKQPAIRF